MIYNFSSSSKSLFFNFKIEDFLSPWIIKVDFDNELIETKKRNWFLIGFQKKSVPLRFIRSIAVDEHIFGADIIIKTMGEILSVKFFDKKDARTIKNLLMDYNKGKRNQIIFS